MTKAKQPRSYRATDSTMINVAASKKRHTSVVTRIARLERTVSAQHRRIGAVLAKVVKLDNFTLQLLRQAFPGKKGRGY